MLNLSDFTKGEKAYILDRNRGYSGGPKIVETTVASVGKTYVHTENGRKYMRHGTVNGLFEKTNYTPTELYTTYEQAKCEIKHEALVIAVRQSMRFLYKCSMDELRDMYVLLCERGSVEPDSEIL